jgi:hypothetical protein
VPNLGIILILAAAVASPAPSPTPTDPCGAPHTNLLAALNRPSIGFAACALKPGEGVAEIGYQNNVTSDTHAPQYPQGFLRFGAAPNLELGVFDSGVGAKYEMWHDGERALAADFLYSASTQTLNLDYSMPLGGNFSFASTLGAQSGRFFTLLPSAIVTDQWSPRAQAFIEAFGQTQISSAGGSLFGMDAALQYLLARNLEVDVEVGRTSSDGERLHYAGFGFGVKF